jgi:hypothetical protein
VIARALAGRMRQRVMRAPGGYQQVLEYERLGGRLSRVRLAHADSAGLVAVVDSLSMIARPYNPPHVDVRRLAGTFHVDDDSLWWRGATLRLPATTIAGAATIGFGGGMVLDVRADPFALADVRWLYPRLPAEGGGRMTITLRDPKGEPVAYDVRDTRLSIGGAWAEGSVSLVAADTVVVRSADVRFAGITTDLVQRLAPDARMPRRGTLSGSARVAGRLDGMRTDVRLAFTEAASGRTSRVAATGELGLAGGVRARDLRVSLSPLHVALVAPRSRDFPLGGTVAGTATTAAGTGTMVWTPSATATDLAGNAMPTAAINEPAPVDRDF